MKIFYSWQSWLSKETNHDFIEEALSEATEGISDEFEIEAAIDRDVKGIGGSQAIADTILKKIEECHIFICDVTPVTILGNDRFVPNPNVLIELGYAIGILSWDYIICVVNNEHINKIDNMPFDIRHRSIITYSYDGNISNEISAKSDLAQKLAENIRDIISRGIPTKNKLDEMLLDPKQKIALKQHLKKLVDDTFANCRSSEFIEKRQSFIVVENFEEQFNGVIEFYLGYCRNMIDDFLYVLEHGAEDYSEHIEYCIKKLLIFTEEDIKTRRIYDIWRYIPAILFIYACGTLITSKSKYQYIASLLSKVSTKNPYEGLSDNLRQSPVLIVLGHRDGIYLHVVQHHGNQRNTKRLGDVIRPFISTLLADYIDKSEFSEAFNLFEMLVAFYHTAIKHSYENKINARDTDLWMFPKTIDSSYSDYIANFWHTMGRKGKQAEIIDNVFIKQPEDVLKNLLLYLQTMSNYYSSYAFTPPMRDYQADYQKGLDNS